MYTKDRFHSQPGYTWYIPCIHHVYTIMTRMYPSHDILRVVGPAPSAQPHSKVSRCQLLYLCGIVEVAFPSKKHGMRGTLPRRSSTWQPFRSRAWEQVRACIPVNSFRFYDSSCPQAKFPKGAEDNQVERNVLVGTVEAVRRSS